MCLFDVVVALDVNKIEEKWLFLYFFEVLQHLPTFSDIIVEIADKLHSGFSTIYSLTRYITLGP